MKTFNRWQLILLAILIAPATLLAQNYNDLYNFRTQYVRSVHTCARQISNGLLIEGGTVDNPNISAIEKVVELGRVNPGNGIMFPTPFFYSFPGRDHNAVDLIESSLNPNWVIVVSNVFDPVTGNTQLGIFKTNPATGAIAWSQIFGNAAFPYVSGAAIARDGTGRYYVLGNLITGGQRYMYLIAITDAGVVNWERAYVSPGAVDNHEAVDVLHDGANVIITGNFSNPAPNGAVIASINPGTGFITNARRITVAGSIVDIRVRDMDLVNGRYVLVGMVNSFPRQGFLIQYNPGLVPFAPFEQTYFSGPDDIYLTGVKPSPTNNIYVSYDYQFAGAVAPIPGIARLNVGGIPITQHVYNVNNYLGSKGLVALNGFNNYVVKGGTFANSFPGLLPSLSLVGTGTPMAIMPVLCNNPVPVTAYQSAQEITHSMSHKIPNTAAPMALVVQQVRGGIYDCSGAFLVNFRLAPTAIEENEEVAGMNIYPNPSSGLFTLEMSKDLAGRYATMEVFNVVGEMVMQFNINQPVQSIDLSGQLPGVYMIRMKTSDGQVGETKRIMIQR